MLAQQRLLGSGALGGQSLLVPYLPLARRVDTLCATEPQSCTA